MDLSSPGTKARRLQDAILKVYQVHVDARMVPTSIRFLFYELEQKGTVSKARRVREDGVVGRRTDQDVIDQMTRLRELGFIPWSHIVDETRSLTEWACAPTVRDYVLERLDEARLDPWHGRGVRPLIITEARTIGGVLKRRIAPEYLVAIASTNGACKGFLKNEVIPLLRKWIEKGQRPHIAYIGDFDLCGNDIEENTKNVLRDELGDDTFTWERVAITGKQTKTLKQRGVEPIKKNDKRFKRGAGRHLAFEAEALGQGFIESVLTRKLDALLRPDTLQAVHEREERERKQVRKQLAKLMKK